MLYASNVTEARNISYLHRMRENRLIGFLLLNEKG